ncbi:MAG: hypothetical protein JWL88_428 [Parcubacteria group bacterium]|nr:hypothetical protein [Parcubacteria group bacterium]
MNIPFRRAGQDTATSAAPVSQLPDRRKIGLILGTTVCLIFIYVVGFSDAFAVEYTKGSSATSTLGVVGQKIAAAVQLPQATNPAAYNKKMLAIANYASTTSTTTTRLWPAKASAGVYPNAGALLPTHRIIAYYGNFYSTKMGILGQNPPSIMIPQLQAEVAKWNAADPSTPAIPAIDYIAITAQGSPGSDGKYRFRMPDSEIDKAVALANQVHGIVILDVQVGLSTLPVELPLLDKYLSMPNVHLAIDPEFAMHNGAKPGSVVGTFSSADVNYAANHLAKLVQENNLPPKILIVHRFTQNMVTGYQNIKPLPEVQVVMDMDGWGSPAKKLNTYQQFIATQPVQFTGFKLFYKNDLKPPSTRMLTPKELLKLTPQPLFIQFQ